MRALAPELRRTIRRAAPPAPAELLELLAQPPQVALEFPALPQEPAAPASPAPQPHPGQ